MSGWYLIAYDIRNPRRLGRVHYYLSKNALAVQYSVYLLQADKATLADILFQLKTRVDLREDDVRLYPVPNPNTIWAAGVQAGAFDGLYYGKKPSKDKPAKWKRFIQNLFGRAR